MASALSRAKLARAAARLNIGRLNIGHGIAGLLVLMTDDERLADPLAAARALPRGALVIIRARDARRRAFLAAALRPLDLILLAADDPALAATLHGIHLPEVRAHEAGHWRARHPGWLISVAAHDARSLHGASHADIFLLSPVFASESHRGQAPLTPVRARLMARASERPVIALGGVTARNAALLAGFCGAAAIGALS